MKTPKLIKNVLVAATAFSLASTWTTHAVTITSLVETPDSLSFNFSGSGILDFIKGSLPALTYWECTREEHALNLTTYGFSINFRHLPDGSIVSMGDSSSITPYGTIISDTETVAHGPGLDTYNFGVTVQSNGSTNAETVAWTDFSGTFSAQHTSTAVPEGGGTFAMLALALAGLVAVPARRK